ncbi:unnamed protein product [Caenorhabditis auriculariae]|uniref:Uncharacterized protein n=1 Tax=Caenorhabditis auriculariae TaxID=2777116 RepID=A0A8S1H4Q4_9PELO|nr:unnamed protein product [Caenorhabditis auriculariae]
MENLSTLTRTSTTQHVNIRAANKETCVSMEEIKGSFLENLANKRGNDKKDLKILAMSNAESVAQIFPQWVRLCYRKGETNYEPYDMNMPTKIIPRPIEHYRFDPPLTERGLIVAETYGRGLRKADFVPFTIYCSPDLKSVQTACAIVKGMDSSSTSICIEPALAPWRQMYPPYMHKAWFSPRTFSNMKNPIDERYEPMIKASVLKSESTMAYGARVARFFAHIVANSDDEQILVISDNCMVDVTRNMPMSNEERIFMSMRRQSCQFNTILLQNGQAKLCEKPLMPFTKTLLEARSRLPSGSRNRRSPSVQRAVPFFRYQFSVLSFREQLRGRPFPILVSLKKSFIKKATMNGGPPNDSGLPWERQDTQGPYQQRRRNPSGRGRGGSRSRSRVRPPDAPPDYSSHDRVPRLPPNGVVLPHLNDHNLATMDVVVDEFASGQLVLQRAEQVVFGEGEVRRIRWMGNHSRASSTSAGSPSARGGGRAADGCGDRPALREQLEVQNALGVSPAAEHDLQREQVGFRRCRRLFSARDPDGTAGVVVVEDPAFIPSDQIDTRLCLLALVRWWGSNKPELSATEFVTIHSRRPPAVLTVLEVRVAAPETIESSPDCALGHCILLARSADVGDRGARVVAQKPLVVHERTMSTLVYFTPNIPQAFNTQISVNQMHRCGDSITLPPGDYLPSLTVRDNRGIIKKGGFYNARIELEGNQLTVVQATLIRKERYPMYYSTVTLIKNDVINQLQEYKNVVIWIDTLPTGLYRSVHIFKSEETNFKWRLVNSNLEKDTTTESGIVVKKENKKWWIWTPGCAVGYLGWVCDRQKTGNFDIGSRVEFIAWSVLE